MLNSARAAADSRRQPAYGYSTASAAVTAGLHIEFLRCSCAQRTNRRGTHSHSARATKSPDPTSAFANERYENLRSIFRPTPKRLHLCCSPLRHVPSRTARGCSRTQLYYIGCVMTGCFLASPRYCSSILQLCNSSGWGPNFNLLPLAASSNHALFPKPCYVSRVQSVPKMGKAVHPSERVVHCCVSVCTGSYHEIYSAAVDICAIDTVPTIECIRILAQQVSQDLYHVPVVPRAKQSHRANNFFAAVCTP